MSRWRGHGAVKGPTSSPQKFGSLRRPECLMSRSLAAPRHEQPSRVLLAGVHPQKADEWQLAKRTHAQELRPSARPAAHVLPQRAATRGQSQSKFQIPPDVSAATVMMVNAEASYELVDATREGTMSMISQSWHHQIVDGAGAPCATLQLLPQPGASDRGESTQGCGWPKFKRSGPSLATKVRRMIRSWDSGDKTRLAAPLLIFLPFAKILHLVRIWACFKPFGIAKDCLGIRTDGYASRKLAHPLGHIPWCLTQVLHGSVSKHLAS